MAIDRATRIPSVLQAVTESHQRRARALRRARCAMGLTEAGATLRPEFECGLGYGACDHWAGGFDMTDDLGGAGEALGGSYMDHPSLAEHVSEGLFAWIL
ncbi:MAG TPA: hypothetical protein VNF73_16930 [Candidatus Saccharimonadales bacterium]|nr:hypothetical protein [Candidatus Saccharimonadales bacterium]